MGLSLNAAERQLSRCAEGIDCHRPLKRCVRVCIWGKRRDLPVQLPRVKTTRKGGLFAGPNTEVVVNFLEPEATEDFAPDVAAAPSDANQRADWDMMLMGGRNLRRRRLVAHEAQGEVQDRGQGAALTVRGLKTNRALRVGCDVSRNVEEFLNPRPCVELPEGTVVGTLLVTVGKTGGSSALKRRRLARWATTAQRAEAAGTPFRLLVLDVDGRDRTEDYRSCCFNDGVGILDSLVVLENDDDCPPCRSPMPEEESRSVEKRGGGQKQMSHAVPRAKTDTLAWGSITLALLISTLLLHATTR